MRSRSWPTTREFLSHFGFDTLRDLPEMEALEDAGLLSKDRLLAAEFPLALMPGEGEEEPEAHSVNDQDI